jgi:hypothetical protein
MTRIGVGFHPEHGFCNSVTNPKRSDESRLKQ